MRSDGRCERCGMPDNGTHLCSVPFHWTWLRDTKPSRKEKPMSSIQEEAAKAGMVIKTRSGLTPTWIQKGGDRLWYYCVEHDYVVAVWPNGHVSVSDEDEHPRDLVVVSPVQSIWYMTDAKGTRITAATVEPQQGLSWKRIEVELK